MKEGLKTIEQELEEIREAHGAGSSCPIDDCDICEDVDNSF